MKLTNKQIEAYTEFFMILANARRRQILNEKAKARDGPQGETNPPC